MPCTFFLFTTFTWRKFLVKHEIWNGTNTHTYTYRHIRIKRRMLSANTGCSTFDNVITSLQPTAATTMVIRARHFLFLIFYVLFSSLFHMFVPLKNRTPPKDKSNAWIMNERLLQKKTNKKICMQMSECSVDYYYYFAARYMSKICIQHFTASFGSCLYQKTGVWHVIWNMHSKPWNMWEFIDVLVFLVLHFGFSVSDASK